MAMLTFLLTITVCSVLIFVGYRVSMFLYMHGAVGVSPHQMSKEAYSLREARDASLIRVRDYSLRYGLLIFAVLMLVIVIGLVVLISWI